MKAFEFAAPRNEGQVVELLAPHWGPTEILAGGTDLVGLLKRMVLAPERVVSLHNVASLGGIDATSQGVRIGATTHLDEMLDEPALDGYAAVKQAIGGIASLQLQSQGTLGGELCQRPHCWYFRNGRGLLAENGRLVAGGENRYHAILGNQGPARFVSASRLAPALIALGAQIRLAGPAPGDETRMPLEWFYRAPRHEQEREYVLLPNQVLTDVYLPPVEGWSSGTYEVRHGAGPDAPLAAAAAALRIERGVVRDARIVMGHVAPTPWVSSEAATALVGRAVDADSALAAGEAAVAAATPLSDNRYKVQLARVAVERAILLAAELETGGF